MKTTKQTPAQKVELFEKRRAKVIELVRLLIDKVYPGDKEMLAMGQRLEANITVSDYFTDELARKLLGFFIWMLQRRRLPAENGPMLSTLLHDIGGTLRQERFFVPRVEMYLEFYNDAILETTFPI